MKYYLLFIIIVVKTSYSQNNNNNNNQLFIDYGEDIHIQKVYDSNSYEVYFYIKSNDPRFKVDLFKFVAVNDVNFDNEDFENYGVEVVKKGIKIVGLDYFSSINVCEIHEELSLTKNIFLIKKISKEKFKIWRVNYLGTAKDLIITNFNH